MRPDFLSFTGLTLATDIGHVVEISKTFSENVEWAILVRNDDSNDTHGGKFCSPQEVDKLLELGLPKLALHIVDFTQSRTLWSAWKRRIREFSRIQLNGSEHLRENTRLEFHDVDLIATHQAMEFPSDTRFSWLFDRSGGTGLTPTLWPSYAGDALVGFAGGLNLDNVQKAIQAIDATKYWLDMETGIRVNGKVDPSLCEQVVQLVLVRN